MELTCFEFKYAIPRAVSKRGCMTIKYIGNTYDGNNTFYVTRRVFNAWAETGVIYGVVVRSDNFPYGTLNVLKPF